MSAHEFKMSEQVRRFYIMPSSVPVLLSCDPAYTPMTNHLTDVHTVPLVLATDYDALHAEAEALRAENAALRAKQGERQEAVHWRALLHTDQRPQQLHDKHVVGFTTRESAEAWVAEKKDFQGWEYSIEPLYTTPQPGPDVRALVEALQEIVKQYPNPNISHVDYRVHACRNAEQALAAHRQAQRK